MQREQMKRAMRGGVCIVAVGVGGGSAWADLCPPSTGAPSGICEKPQPHPRPAGDIDGDGFADIALLGGPGWTTIPVAFSNGDGTFRVTNSASPAFPSYATIPGAVALAGDFNGDGESDLALTGGAGWTTLPVAFSNADGTFRSKNLPIMGFATDAAQPGVRPVAGDFDGDGSSDIALVGGSGWSTIPIAFSNGDGSFRVTNLSAPGLASFAQVSGARVVAGDFNDDHKSDLALTGGAGWNTIPVALSNGDGTFQVTNEVVASFPQTAAGALAVAGDFNGDGSADIALTGGTGWDTIAVAFSNGDGTFRVTNVAAAGFPTWAATNGTQAVAADFNGDGMADLALTGVAGWSTLPVAFSNGDGSFNITNDPVAGFPAWASQSLAVSASEASR
jgi:hypothetical protein